MFTWYTGRQGKSRSDECRLDGRGTCQNGRYWRVSRLNCRDELMTPFQLIVHSGICEVERSGRQVAFQS